MTFEELNVALKALLEAEEIEQAKALYMQEKDVISAFDNRQKYIINEKMMIFEYKSSHYEESLRINRYIDSLAPELGEQFVLNASLWKINILLAKEEYNIALYNANMLKMKVPENASYGKKIKSDINNTLLRIYIDSKKYKRMKKLSRKMFCNHIDQHNKMKMLMNVGATYYSLGKYNLSSSLFYNILTSTQDNFFLGCANLYLARMALPGQKEELYINSIKCFQELGNFHLLSIAQREYDMLHNI